MSPPVSGCASVWPNLSTPRERRFGYLTASESRWAGAQSSESLGMFTGPPMKPQLIPEFKSPRGQIEEALADFFDPPPNVEPVEPIAAPAEPPNHSPKPIFPD